MKHILNDMSEQEKNSIREQHTGGMKVMTENFSKLINSKLGDSKPLVNEQQSQTPTVSGSEMEKFLSNSGNGFNGIQAAVKFCKSKKVANNQKNDGLEELIYQAISGVENPLNLMGGSPGLEKVAQILNKNISNTTELCSLIGNFMINGEDFETAIKGEVNTKMNSVGAADHVLLAINSINRRG